MLNFTFMDHPDVEAYARDIKAEGASILVDLEYVQALFYEYSALLATALTELETHICNASHGTYKYFSKGSMIKTLIQYCYCDDQNFVQDMAGYTAYTRQNTARLADNPYWSISMPAVILPLLESIATKLEHGQSCLQYENAYDILSSYINYRHLQTRVNQISAKITKYILPEEIPGWTKPLHPVNFQYVQKSTGRFYTENDSIQNWPLELTKTISVEKDYFLFWCDFDQIDLRVGYHIYLAEPRSEADRIYLEETDKYRAIYKIICKSANKEPDLDLFAKYRPAYKKAILSAMYNASEQSLKNDIKNSALAHELYEFFKNNERYQSYVRAIRDNIDYNVDLIVRDYFGTERSIQLPNLNSKADVQSAIAAACNTPIQSTSNSIMELWLEAVLARFESLGYSRTKHVIPYLIRHDECIFKVHNSVMKDLWVFKDCMSVALDNWDTLTLEPHLGLYYKTPLKIFEEKYEVSCLKHANDYTDRTVFNPRTTTYRPISEILEVYAYTLNDLCDYAFSAYSRLRTQVQLPEVPTGDYHQWDKTLCLEILQKCSEIEPELKKLLQSYGKFFLYSHKKKAYKLTSTLADVANVARTIQTNKILCHTLNTRKSMYHEGLMIKVDTQKQDITNKLFNKLVAGEVSSDWITL